NLDQEGRDAAARAGNEDHAARPRLAVRYDHAPGGEPAQRQRRRLEPGQALRPRPDLLGADDDALRVRALVRHAEDADVRPCGLLARSPVERGVDHDLVAGPKAPDAGSA